MLQFPMDFVVLTLGGLKNMGALTSANSELKNN